MDYREPRIPSPQEEDTIRHITHLAGVAIERKLAESARRQSEAYLEEAQRLSHRGVGRGRRLRGNQVLFSRSLSHAWFRSPRRAPRFEIFFQRICWRTRTE